MRIIGRTCLLNFDVVDGNVLYSKAAVSVGASSGLETTECLSGLVVSTDAITANCTGRCCCHDSHVVGATVGHWALKVAQSQSKHHIKPVYSSK